jgi:hypothetical protein
MRIHEPELLVLDGALAAARGELSDATVLLTEADKSASEMGRKPVRIEALSRSAAVRAKAGDHTGANADRDRARSILHELVSAIADAELRAAFEAIQTSRVEALARAPSPA